MLSKGQVVVYRKHPGLFRVVDVRPEGVSRSGNYFCFFYIEAIDLDVGDDPVWGEPLVRAVEEDLISAEKLGLWPIPKKIKPDPTLEQIEEANYKAKRDANLRGVFMPPLRTTTTYHGFSVEVDGNVIGRVTEWKPEPIRMFAEPTVYSMELDSQFLREARAQAFGLRSDFMDRVRQKLNKR